MASYLRYAEVLYKCRLCHSMPAILPSEAAFVAHMESIHLGEEAVKNCNLCDLKFTSVEDLQVHLNQYHKHSLPADRSSSSHNPSSQSASQISWGNTTTAISNIPSATEPIEQSPTTESNILPTPVAGNATETVDAKSGTEQEHVKLMSRRGRRPQMDARPDIAMPSALRTELQLKFGKYASTILIKGMIYFYCQVCMYKTSTEEEFNIHFHCEEHRRTALKLEQPWMQTVPWLQSPVSPRRILVSSDAQTSKTDVSVADTGLKSATSTELPVTHWGIEDLGKRSKRRKTSESRGIWEEVQHENGVELEAFSECEKAIDDSPRDASSKDPPPEPVHINITAAHTPSPTTTSTPSTPLPPRKPSHPKGTPSCLRCGFLYSTFPEYAQHCTEYHGDMDVVEAELTYSPASKVTTIETQKVEKLKPFIASILLPDISGTFVCRDELLTQVQARMGLADVMQWGAACNRAVRECFPASGIARRTRGKEDKHLERRGSVNRTLFTGVRLVTRSVDGPHLDEEEQEEISSDVIRDVSKDTETLLVELPGLLRWTGDMESSIQRDDLLHYLAQAMRNADVVLWCIACNRAIRQLFPDVIIKRRGYKSKCTFFHGVGFVQSPGNEGSIPSGMVQCGTKAVEYVSEERNTIKMEQGDNGSHPLMPASTLPHASTEAIACLILLHPGPIVTSRNLMKCHKSQLPTMVEVIQAMELLESLAIGQMFNFSKMGGMKCFYKIPPLKEVLDNQLMVLHVEFERYREAFAERDDELDNLFHDRLLTDYPFSLDLLHKFYQSQ